MLPQTLRWSVLLVAILLLGFPAALRARGESVRERIRLNSGWTFSGPTAAGLSDGLSYGKLKPWLLHGSNAFRNEKVARPAGEPPGKEVPEAQPGFDDSGWRRLEVPHDWGVEAPFSLDLPGESGRLPWWGVAWYRKHLPIDPKDEGKRIVLQFDGVMSFATVWCNGKFVGGWPYGYASWSVDLTPHLEFGRANVVAVRVDNPPDSSRWYPGGGIYQDVWLEKTHAIHVPHAGTRVVTRDAEKGAADVTLEVDIANTTGQEADFTVTAEIFRLSPEGRRTREARTRPLQVRSRASETVSLKQSLVLKSPRRWSPETPNLYVAAATIARGGTVLDRHETVFGVRTASFTAEDGFHLNGKRLPLKGVCLHHDLGALGAAYDTQAAERQLRTLKEMGANAIRTSHNPPAPDFLDLCDRLGFVVIDELTDTWTVAKKPNGYVLLFADWAEADLRAMIRRDRNHPCVVAWSTGNEVGEQRNPALHPVSERLAAIARAEDASRPTTVGCDFPGAGYNGFQKTIDVFGYNYKPWEYAKFRTQNPGIPLYGSETASTVSSRGIYAFPVSEDKSEGKVGFHVSSYDLYAPAWAMPADREFQGQDENPSVAGEFVWTGFDYLGEPTPFNSDLTVLTNFHNPEARAKAERELAELGRVRVPSRSSYFGIVDLAGFRKDRFYLYQARWRPELPMAHLLPHWTWPGREGEVTPVHVYTSGDEAELFLNGRSLGRKKKGAGMYRLRWDDVRYEAGELRVVAYKSGQAWAEDRVQTAGQPARIVLEQDVRAGLGAGGLAFVQAVIVDEAGRPVPDAAQRLMFAAEGATVLATDNGDPTDLEPFQAAQKRAFSGRALAILRVPKGTKLSTVRVTADGLVGAELRLK